MSLAGNHAVGDNTSCKVDGGGEGTFQENGDEGLDTGLSLSVMLSEQVASGGKCDADH